MCRCRAWRACSSPRPTDCHDEPPLVFLAVRRAGCRANAWSARLRSLRFDEDTRRKHQRKKRMTPTLRVSSTPFLGGSCCGALTCRVAGRAALRRGSPPSRRAPTRSASAPRPPPAELPDAPPPSRTPRRAAAAPPPRLLLRHAEQEPPGGLRVPQQDLQRLAHAGGDLATWSAPASGCACSRRAPRPPRRARARPRAAAPSGVEVRVEPGGVEDVGEVAQQPEPGHVGARGRAQARPTAQARSLRSIIWAVAAATSAALAEPARMAWPTIPVPSGLVSTSDLPLAGARGGTRRGRD